MPSSDTYIEKDSSVNDEIDRLRHCGHLGAAHPARHHRRGLGVVHLRPRARPTSTADKLLVLQTGEEHRPARRSSRKLVDMQYERNDMNLVRGKFRVRGDTIEVHPAYDETAVRIELFGDEIEPITDRRSAHRRAGQRARASSSSSRPPTTWPATSGSQLAIERIEAELQERLAYFEKEGKLLEAQRLRMRTAVRPRDDGQELGFCNGIENYSAPIDGRAPGEAPYTLLDFFPDDFLMVIDESHVAVPQLHGQYEGDRSRKEHADRARVPAAVGGRQPAAAVRGVSSSGSARSCSCRPRPGPYELRALRPASSSRSCDPPAWSTPRSS